jgi:peptidoglycan/LPS O-acetylase OafA/YrhL
MAPVQRPRYEYLDVLRAMAVLLLVFFHATGYLLLRRETGDVGLAFRWIVHVFHMPLFFVLSGFVLGLAARRTGIEKQIRSRWRRLAIPFLVGMVTVIPAIKLVGLYFQSTKPEAGRDKVAITFGNVFSLEPQHLWFLEYLFYLSAIILGVWWLWRRYGSEEREERLRIPLMAALVVLPTVTVLLDGGWEASYQPDTMAPDLWLSFYYFCFLAAGWLLSTKDGYREAMEKAPGTKLLVGAAVVAASYAVWRHNAPDLQSGSRIAHLFVLAGGGAATWLIISGLWGLMAKVASSPGPRLRLFSEQSYWMYIVHLPMLVFIESELAKTSLPVVVRWLLAIAITVALCVITYVLFVKDKPLSRVLGEKPRKSAAVMSPASAPSPQNLDAARSIATVPGYVSKPSHAPEPGRDGSGLRAGDGPGTPPPPAAPQAGEQPIPGTSDRDDREEGPHPIHPSPGLPDGHGDRGGDRDV